MSDMEYQALRSHADTGDITARDRLAPFEKLLSDFSVGIAVGTAVAGGPPHRSVREVLPHTALALSRAQNR